MKCIYYTRGFLQLIAQVAGLASIISNHDQKLLSQLPVGMTYKAAQQQECLTASLQLQLVQQCSLACHSLVAMWSPHMTIHVIADVIITVCGAGCGWSRRGGAEEAADGSICIVQMHKGFIVISTQAPHMQRLHLGSTKQLTAES